MPGTFFVNDFVKTKLDNYLQSPQRQRRFVAFFKLKENVKSFSGDIRKCMIALKKKFTQQVKGRALSGYLKT
jgi:hypothetical protein